MSWTNCTTKVVKSNEDSQADHRTFSDTPVNLDDNIGVMKTCAMYIVDDGIPLMLTLLWSVFVRM